MTTLLTDTAVLTQSAPPLYHFVKDMTTTQLRGLITYLQDSKMHYPHLPLTEVWDLGIGMAIEELRSRGEHATITRVGTPPLRPTVRPVPAIDMDEYLDHIARTAI